MSHQSRSHHISEIYIPKETRDDQGRLHSFRGTPALVTENGTVMYYWHGKLHRGNGPARIFNNSETGTTIRQYWIDGKLYPQKEFNKMDGEFGVPKKIKDIFDQSGVFDASNI